MKLTPIEVRKQTFRKTMRGFDPEDVRVFLDMVAEEHEQLLQQNGMLNEKVRHLNEQLERYHGMERTLQNSLLTAERVVEEARDRSKLDAETIVEDARLRAERILGDSRERLRILSREIQELHSQKGHFIRRMSSLLEAQSDLLTDRSGDLEAIGELDLKAEALLVEANHPLPELGEDESSGVEDRAEQAAGGDDDREERLEEDERGEATGFFKSDEGSAGFFGVSADKGTRP